MLGLIPNPRLRPAVELWGKHFGTLKKLKLQVYLLLGEGFICYIAVREHLAGTGSLLPWVLEIELRSSDSVANTFIC